MKRYDLRSDTITKPTDEMRKAMYQAEVGDDVYREDPTTTRLEELAAHLSGKRKLSSYLRVPLATSYPSTSMEGGPTRFSPL